MKRLCLLLLLLTGCRSLLPEGGRQVDDVWGGFNEAKAAFDRIEPYRSGAEDLQGLGFDPGKKANVQILNYSQVAHAVLPSASLPLDAQPRGVRECILAQDRCIGYQIEQSRVKRKRIGGFWADFLNFSRETEIVGWRFVALVILVDGLVVFKQWSGQPALHEMERSHNPLGPLQGLGEGIGGALR
ncbi:hypothetical protein B9N43_05800 [Denitratisoma sp. DHT3]|uniref:hypothetical protein n=1 Tax=Denitratisoma sp. DHT3 TaxID=1981880 RepID=UPI0011983EA1|nr:hypothetical protein [Denitratisoma sp. DHT3]QDX80798.1 hypothetical protein B9N43_05800 [Denitratisoma sp. DHT3]